MRIVNKSALFLMVFAFMSAVLPVVGGNKAYACGSCTASVTPTEAEEWLAPQSGTVPLINMHVFGELTAQKMWMISLLWEDNILPALMMMADQLTAVALYQTQIIGSFMDAKNQMETQLALQKISARAHKDYHPSVGMCQFATGVKSLARSDRLADYNALIISQRAQDRNTGSSYTVGRLGDVTDRAERMTDFRSKYCSGVDNNNALSAICGAAEKRTNKDIDFSRTVDFPWTLHVDFTDGAVTEHEEEVLALGANLFGHDLFNRVAPRQMAGDSPQVATDLQAAYMDARSIMAKRSVAENSFSSIVAMKSEGSDGSREYIRGVLREMGLSEKDAVQMLHGEPWNHDDSEWKRHKENTNPSYHAQMEILTKKLTQNPDFYTNLYDKPVNVERKGVALQAIGLMQKFDLFKSYLRQEASASVLLELAIMDLQEFYQNEQVQDIGTTEGEDFLQ